jgi:molybdopterin converting factor small subunit
MVICLTVRFLGIFQRLSGKKHYELTLQEPATIKDVVTKLSEAFSDEFKAVLVDAQLDDPRPNALILVDGKEVSALQGLETEVTDSQEIVFLPMVHGG